MTKPLVLAFGIILLAGCSGKDVAKNGGARDSVAGSAGGMQGMTMQGVQMMPMMRAHLDSLVMMSPEQMASRMAAHQDMTSRMMDAMGADMRGMGMTADSTWTALADSLKADLADLPALSGQPLQSRTDAHAGRLRRMMDLHQQMMQM